MRALIYVEIDIKYCELTYGVPPCNATVGITGEQPCFNTRNQSADCQDIDSFTPGTKTLRLGLRDCGYLPEDIPCIPLLRDASVTNAVVKPGESIGERATIRATFWNGRHGDAGIDKYIIARDYNPFEQGTFWGKFRARNPYIEARPIRIYRGYLGQSLEEMDCEHFVIDSLIGPDSSGTVTITGSDFMRLLNGEKAQAPMPNSGYLEEAIGDSVGNFTLRPVGIGNKEYPASGKASLGKETVTFTRTGDNFFVMRGRDDTAPSQHSAGTVLQMMLEYTSESAATIVNDLITNYSPLDSSFTNLPAWVEIVERFAPVLYTRRIPRPTPTVELINELIEQAGLVMFGDTRTNTVVFDVLRPNPETGLPIGPDEILAGTFKQADQPRKRYSQVWVFYGKRDPYAGDGPENFYSALIYPVAENLYETINIKKIFSKWIPSPGRSVAEDVAARAIARYQFPPRRVHFSLFAENTRRLGQVIDVTDPSLETATGEQDRIRAIITGVTDDVDRHDIEGEEYNIRADMLSGDRVIQFDYNALNVNLRQLYDIQYSSIDDSGETRIIFVVASGVVVGSPTSGYPGMTTGSWPAGVVPRLVVSPGGYVVGAGGRGGYGSNPAGPGGPALQVTSPIELDNQGTIGGGGGGGGGSILSPLSGYSFPPQWNTGGGGAGSYSGPGNPPGTLTKGGNYSPGSPHTYSDGGDLGKPGKHGGTGPGLVGYPGGAAGNAIIGNSLITYINAGDIRGPVSG